MAKIFSRHGRIITLCLISACVLLFFSYQYARLTSFPIGDDPAIHVNIIKTQSYGELTSQIYPLPLIFYKLAYSLTGIEAAKLFTLTISVFLFFSSAALFIFTWRIFQSFPAALATGIFFVTDRWVVDSLRMGTLAEVFGWGMLFIALTALLSRNLVWTIVCAILVGLSHPFSFSIYIIIVLLYGLIIFFRDEGDDRQFLRRLLPFAIVGSGILALFKPGIFWQFLHFKTGDAPGWGERTLWQMFIQDEAKLLVFPMLAVFGLARSTELWGKPGVKLAVLLLFVGLVMTFNHMIGIQFLPFRFYAYFIAGLAIFAGYGLLVILQSLMFPQWGLVFVSTILAIYFSLPAYAVNAGFLNWQKNDPTAKASLQPEERDTIQWIEQNLPVNAQILAERRYGIWIRALSGRQDIIFYDGEPELTIQYVKRRLEKGPIYIYAPVNTDLPIEAFDSGQTIFIGPSVSILKVNP